MSRSQPTAPTRRMIKTCLDSMDQRRAVRKRQGSKAAREQFAAVAGEFKAKLAMEFVQIDHPLGDIVLANSIVWQTFCRPGWAEFLIRLPAEDRLDEVSEAYQGALGAGPRWQEHLELAINRVPEIENPEGAL